MASKRRVGYTRLAGDEDLNNGDGVSQQYDPRFDYSPRKLDQVPWKSIALAVFLLLLGCTLLLLSFFIFTGHMRGDRSQAYGFLCLGFISFLPGFYETRMAYYSWRGAQGYRCELYCRIYFTCNQRDSRYGANPVTLCETVFAPKFGGMVDGSSVTASRPQQE